MSEQKISGEAMCFACERERRVEDVTPIRWVEGQWVQRATPACVCGEDRIRRFRSDPEEFVVRGQR